jgi:general secretion pathway protein K
MRQDESGFALMLVIWVLGLLALLAAVVATDSQSSAQIVRSQLALAQSRLAADSGITLALANLVNLDSAQRWSADDAAHAVDYAGGVVTITIEDEGGKIDLNQAPLELIRGLLNEFGVDPNAQASLTNAVQQRRDAFGRAYPASSRVYAAARNSIRNLAQLAFADSSELRLVPGMTTSLYRRLLPYITVYSGSATVNPLTASRTVLGAIPGITSDDIEALIVQRSQDSNQTNISGSPSIARYLGLARPSAVTITAQVALPGGVSFVRQALVGLYPTQPFQPVQIIAWREPLLATTERTNP